MNIWSTVTCGYETYRGEVLLKFRKKHFILKRLKRQAKLTDLIILSFELYLWLICVNQWFFP
jgi:hypothetical protein